MLLFYFIVVVFIISLSFNNFCSCFNFLSLIIFVEVFNLLYFNLFSVYSLYSWIVVFSTEFYVVLIRFLFSCGSILLSSFHFVWFDFLVLVCFYCRLLLSLFFIFSSFNPFVAHFICCRFLLFPFLPLSCHILAVQSFCRLQFTVRWI